MRVDGESFFELGDSDGLREWEGRVDGVEVCKDGVELEEAG